MAEALGVVHDTPLVCVLLHGGAIALTNKALEACDAILDLWVPGQEAGNALTDILFGAHSPAGHA